MHDKEKALDVERSGHQSSVQRLKEEIGALTRKQGVELLNATYLGLTPQEATEFGARRDRIRELVAQLQQLEDPT